MEVNMLAWLLWFIYALVPAIITVAADLSMQTMTILYFSFILGAVIIKGIWDKSQKAPEEV